MANQQQLNRVTIVETATSRPIAWEEVNEHSNLDGMESEAYLNKLIDAAVDYFQEATRSTLMERRIIATFYDGEPINLPYGPLNSINAITDANETEVRLADYQIRHVGRVPRLILPATTTYPIAVDYWAGYTDPSEIPAATRLALLQLVGAFNENREAITDRQKLVVPHAFDAFLKQRSRQLGVIG